MNYLGYYDTIQEIEEAVLTAFKKYGTIRMATIATKCANENDFFDALNDLKNKGLVDFNDNFIFKPSLEQ